MELFSPTAWSEIFSYWKHSEEEIWKPFYLEKGFSCWETWRNSYLTVLNPEERKWKAYTLSLAELSAVQCGLFPGWRDIAESAQSRRIKDLAKTPFLQEYQKVQAVKKFLYKKCIQEKTEEVFRFIGFRKNSTITLIDGHHRAVAFSQLVNELPDINANIVMYLSDVEGETLPFLDFPEK